jgi:UDP-glucose 4-epimerase
MKKILLTGGRGFIGKHLGKRLVEDGFILASTKDNREELDINNMNQLESSGEDVEIVIHLAAKTSIQNSFMKPYEVYHTNVMGTLNLLELARIKNIRKFIFLSTYVYGQPKYLPIDEKHPTNPHTPYNQSKLIAEQLCQNYSNNFGINIVTLRPFYIYGPSSNPNTFIPSVVQQISKSGKVLLSGEYTKRDFLFVEDFINLIKAVLDLFPRGYNLYNVGYGRNYTLKEVSHILAALLNKKITIEYDDKIRPSDVKEMVADISKVSKEFNWKPSTSLEEGLESTLEYYLSP